MKLKIIFFFLCSVFLSQGFAMLPKGFVYLDQIDPTIRADLRYVTSENFIGKPIEGYKNSSVILTKEAAEALHRVQQDLLAEGYSLVIYDAYRPQKAVNEFVRWSKDLQDNKMKAKYYPRVNKTDLFKLGYVAAKSSHSRGSTVDISIIPVGEKLLPAQDVVVSKRTLQDGYTVLFLDDHTVDMGTSFDLFDVASHENSMEVAPSFVKLRDSLKEKMNKHGFKGIKEEWWHFTLENEPFPKTYFDFDVE